MRPTVPLGLVLVSLASPPSNAADCAGGGGYSGCIDANAAWPRPGPQRFLVLPSADVTAPGQLAFATSATLLLRPLVLDVPASDPQGRNVRLVEHRVEHAVLLAAGLGRGFEAGLALSTVLRQRGSGSSGITSQRAAPLTAATERDVFVGAAYGGRLRRNLALKARIDVALPSGDWRAHAGEGSVVAAPGAAAEWSLGPVTLATSAGLRLRRSVEFGLSRWGSQAELSLGAFARLLDRDRLGVAVEGFALPSVIDATSGRGRELGVRVTSIPAEWLASLRARPSATAPWFVSLGAGSGLPLSAEERGGERHRFFGPTSPALRGVVSIQYSPVARE